MGTDPLEWVVNIRQQSLGPRQYLDQDFSWDRHEQPVKKCNRQGSKGICCLVLGHTGKHDFYTDKKRVDQKRYGKR